jgi:hypothetical protein
MARNFLIADPPVWLEGEDLGFKSDANGIHKIPADEKQFVLLYTSHDDYNANPYILSVKTATSAENRRFSTKERRQLVINQIKAWQKRGNKNMLSDIRKYIADNRDLIYTVAFVAIVDQFLFEGAFRERLKKLVEGFLAKTEEKNKTLTAGV